MALKFIYNEYIATTKASENDPASMKEKFSFMENRTIGIWAVKQPIESLFG
jgi:hypothetical protein